MDSEFWWFTFGQGHAHRVDGVTFDCNIVVEIKGSYESARERMVELFGQAWSHQYEEGKLDLAYFPRGVHVIGGS